MANSVNGVILMGSKTTILLKHKCIAYLIRYGDILESILLRFSKDLDTIFTILCQYVLCQMNKTHHLVFILNCFPMGFHLPVFFSSNKR